MNFKSQSGNALWFILVAIILLGVLTMLLSRSGNYVTQSAEPERLRIMESQLVRYAKGLESAIEQMKIRGTSDDDISFQNTITAANYANADCTKTDCKVFDAGGGGQDYRAAASGVNDGSQWVFTAHSNIGSTANPVGTTAAGSGNDIIMILPNVNPDLCIQINRDLRVGTPGTLPQESSALDLTPFTGTYDAGALRVIDGGVSHELDGKSAGCFIATAPNPDVTYFYYVLLAR
jgi:hypothetical protein